MAIVRGTFADLLKPGLALEMETKRVFSKKGVNPQADIETNLLLADDFGAQGFGTLWFELWCKSPGTWYSIENQIRIHQYSPYHHIYIPTHRDRFVKWEDEDKYDIDGNPIPQSHIIKPKGLILPKRKKLWTGVDLYNDPRNSAQYQIAMARESQLNADGTWGPDILYREAPNFMEQSSKAFFADPVSFTASMLLEVQEKFKKEMNEKINNMMQEDMRNWIQSGLMTPPSPYKTDNTKWYLPDKKEKIQGQHYNLAIFDDLYDVKES